MSKAPLPPNVIGIDPGQSGAIAMISNSRVVDLVDMPTMPRPRGGNEVNGAALASILDKARFPGKFSHTLVALELVNAMPSVPDCQGRRRQMGTRSASNFGESYGKVKGVIETLGLSYQLVSPAGWKKAHGLAGKAKDYSRTIAIQRFPDAASMLTLKKNVGRADALLIAAWAQQQTK